MFLCAYRITSLFFPVSSQTNPLFKCFFREILHIIFTYFAFCLLFCIIISAHFCGSVCFFMLCLREMVFVVY